MGVETNFGGVDSSLIGAFNMSSKTRILQLDLEEAEYSLSFPK